MRDYLDWHDEYDQPGSPLHRRLQVVVELLGHTLDQLPPGPVRLISMCAGQAADVLSVAEHHPRGRDLHGRLVELDPRNVEVARARIDALGLDGLEVVEADAGWSDAYAGATPADLVLACGVFGNITDGDIDSTIAFLPSLCAAGGHVVWTRHPRAPEVIDRIEADLRSAGFDTDVLVIADDRTFGVGAAHLQGPPAPFATGVRLFEFVR